jgi:hypothetical protein
MTPAACAGTVLALGLVFANYNVYLLLFAVVTIAVVAVLPWIVPPHTTWHTGRVPRRFDRVELQRAM